MKIDKQIWGNLKGKAVCLYTISNESMEVSICNLGCTILSIKFKGREIVLGYTSLDDLVTDEYYMGSLVGRFAGRISNAAFSIADTTYLLPANEGESGNHLHGGPKGFNKMLFRLIAEQCGQNIATLSFQGRSRHLDQGYPGNLDITFSISLNSDNEVMFSYFAVPDKPTHINLTHHLYYNLTGSVDATTQNLWVNASSLVETGANYIPTGKIIDTPLDADFSIARKIPANINYNECYVLRASNNFAMAAELSDPGSGVSMQLSTTCPGLIFYSGDFLDAPFAKKQGICLETQYFPDSPNRKNFPSTLYHAGSGFKEYTKLNFKTID